MVSASSWPTLKRVASWRIWSQTAIASARSPERVAVVYVHADGDSSLDCGAHHVQDSLATGVAQRGRDSGCVNEVAAVQVGQDFSGSQAAGRASGASVTADDLSPTEMVEKLDAGEFTAKLGSMDGYPASQLFEDHVAVGVLSEAAYPYGFDVGHQPAEVERDVGLRARNMPGEVAVRVVGADVVGVVLDESFAECEESGHCSVISRKF